MNPQNIALMIVVQGICLKDDTLGHRVTARVLAAASTYYPTLPPDRPLPPWRAIDLYDAAIELVDQYRSYNW